MTHNRITIVLLTVIAFTVLAAPAFATYDTVQGRWLERDPAGYVDGMNRYEYVRSSPLGRLDPAGMISDDPPGPRYPIWEGSGWRGGLPKLVDKWRTPDFVDHYYNGRGATVSLLAVQLLDQFRRHHSVVGAIANLNGQIKSALATERLSLTCDGDTTKTTMLGTTGASERPPNRGGTMFRSPYDVTGVTPLFSLGNGIVKAAVTCDLWIADCECCPEMSESFPTKWGAECWTIFYITDRFEDPLGIGIEPGGEPFTISAYWYERLRFHRPLPTPCL